MHRVNYDEVAKLYDEPSRDHAVDANLVAFVESSKARRSSPVWMLDIACGTGKQLTANHHRFPDMRMVGVDRFAGMLRIARDRCPHVAWLQADGATLPLSSGVFHYITCQFAYPHVRRTRQLLTEAFRVLRPDGRFVMTNIDPWSMPGWLVYRYFPEAHDLDRRDFLPIGEFVSLMRDAGFVGIEAVRHDRSREERLDEFLEFVGTRHRASQLMAISDEGYAGGIRRVKETLAGAQGHEVVARSDFVLVTVTGNKPSA